MVPKRLTTLIAALSLSAVGFAQSNSTASDNEEDDRIVQLSTFVVDTAADVGYLGGNTTSGSRLNTRLKDTAATINVFTAEFIEDLGVNNLEGILGYSSAQTDFGDQNPVFGGSELLRPDSGRQDYVFTVRGLPTTRAINYFRTNVKIDNYNTQRLELSSGPNSVLFGLGSAGGIVNSSTKRADYRKDRGSVRLQAGSHDYLRGELDINQVLIDDRLAIRVMGLSESEDSWRKWVFAEQDRWTAALTFNPLPSTRISLSYEDGSTSRHATKPWGASDEVALWVANGRPTVSGLWRGNQATTRQEMGITRLKNSDSHTFILNDGGYANYRNLHVSTYANLNLPADQRPTDDTMASEDLMSYDYSVSGPDSRFDTEFDVFDVSIEQSLGEHLTAELAYHRENNFTDVLATFQNEIYGDPNEKIVDGSGNLVPNPYVGGLYMESTWNRGTSESNLESIRASLAYDVDLDRWGRYRFAGMFQRFEEDVETIDSREIVVDQNGSPIVRRQAPEDSRNVLLRRQYLTEGDYSTYYNGSPHTPFSANIGGTPHVSRWVHGNQNQMALANESTDTWLLSAQGYFFDDRLVLTAGLREDDVVYSELDRDRLGADDPRVISGERLLNEMDFTDTQSVYEFAPSTRTFGLVWHATEQLSLFYNNSNNAGTPSFRSNVFPDGDIPPPSDGDGQDYGVMVELLDGRVFARLTRFETSSRREAGANIQNLVTAPRNQIHNELLAQNIISQVEYDEWNVNARAALFDGESEGWEANVTANLTSNWVLQAGYSYSDMSRTNFLNEFDPWFADISAFWDAKLAAAGVSSDGIVTARNNTMTEEIGIIFDGVDETREIYELNYGVRPHKANVFTRYTLSEGRLKGFFIGAGARYQGRAILQRDFDTDTLYRGPSLFEMDALLGYSTRLNWGGTNGTRLKLQLNVSNLLNDDDPIVARYNSDFSGIRRVQLVDPRSYRLTATFSF